MGSRTWTPAQPLGVHRYGMVEEDSGGRGNDNATPMPSAPIGVEPKLERLDNGLLVVSGGRKWLMP